MTSPDPTSINCTLICTTPFRSVTSPTKIASAPESSPTFSTPLVSTIPVWMSFFSSMMFWNASPPRATTLNRPDERRALLNFRVKISFTDEDSASGATNGGTATHIREATSSIPCPSRSITIVLEALFPLSSVASTSNVFSPIFRSAG